MTLYPFVVGCDISKHHLDLHHDADGTTRRIANTPDAVAAWIDGLADTAGLVVMEATGRYDAVLRQALAERGIAHARVNPEQARHFARATGRRAKTDALDARMLAELGRRLVKHYGAATRRIVRPVAGSVRVAVDGVMTQGFAVEAEGMVVLDVAPAAGAVVTASFAFDVVVRFADDRLRVARATFLAGEAASVPLIEVRG